MTEKIISKTIRDNKQISKDIFESVDLKFEVEEKYFSIRKKIVKAKRSRSVKISLESKEMIRMLSFLENIVYELGDE